MEVILLERVEKLGAIGDVVKVKDGFARNYLLPQQEGAPRQRSQPQGVRSEPRADRGRQCQPKRSDAEKASKGVDGKTVQLIRQASNTGQLYGSVSARDIVEALEAEGAHVTKSQVVLDRPIKAIGVHEVKIALHPEVVGDGEGQRRPLARRGRPAGAGRRRHGADVRARHRGVHRGLRPERRARRDRRSSGRRAGGGSSGRRPRNCRAKATSEQA